MRTPAESGTATGAGAPNLVHFGKIHAVGVLQSGDDARPVLHFQIRPQNLNVHHFALAGSLAGAPPVTERGSPAAGAEKFVYSNGHATGFSGGAAPRGIG